MCSRKNCTPIIISKSGVIKPSRPSTGHYHLSNICDREGALLAPKEEPITKPKPPDNDESTKRSNTTNENATPGSTLNVEPTSEEKSDPIIKPVTTDIEKDKESSKPLPDNNNETSRTPGSASNLTKLLHTLIVTDNIVSEETEGINEMKRINEQTKDKQNQVPTRDNEESKLQAADGLLLIRELSNI